MRGGTLCTDVPWLVVFLAMCGHEDTATPEAGDRTSFPPNPRAH
jgi:hypothetical protein